MRICRIWMFGNILIAEFGCNEKIKNSSLAQHLKENQEKHIQLLANVIKNQNKKIQVLETKIAQTQNHTFDIQNIAKIDVNQLKNCLNTVQTQIQPCLREVCSQLTLFHVGAFLLFFFHLFWMPGFVQLIVIGGAVFAIKSKYCKTGIISVPLALIAISSIIAFFGKWNCILLPVLIPILIIAKKRFPCGKKFRHITT